MKLLRTLAVTFAQYSRIPMPRFEWNEEDTRYSMSAFPVVGVVIGLVFVAVYNICAWIALPGAATAMILTIVPLIVTGGFHVDGFMDVSDAVSSYRTREEKLAILKDPHIGAFAVIRLAVTGLIYIASLIVIMDSENSTAVICAVAAGFTVARGLSALGVLTLKSAKNEGMLYYEAAAAKAVRKTNLVVSTMWIILGAVFMALFDHTACAMEICAAFICYIWYRHMSYKQFGGITGDTAGYFVVICETAVAAGGAAAALIMR